LIQSIWRSTSQAEKEEFDAKRIGEFEAQITHYAKEDFELEVQFNIGVTLILRGNGQAIT
jgi:hypothetical protein